MAFLRRTNDGRVQDSTKPTPSVLQELAVAALLCPGFSEGQKAVIVLNMNQIGYGGMVNGRGMNFHFGGNHRFSTSWPFHVLVKQPGVSNDLVEVSLPQVSATDADIANGTKVRGQAPS